MNEILPGVHHWTARHPRIKRDVSSYYLERERVLIDPMLPADGIGWWDGRESPTQILLTNRHHYRQSGAFIEAFGCAVRCNSAGMYEFTAGEPVEPFEPGDVIEGGIIVHEVGAISPDETALEITDHRALACADGLVRFDAGAPSFVPDHLMGDDPDAVKRGLRDAYGRLAELEVDNLLLAHGDPVIGGGRDALRAVARA